MPKLRVAIDARLTGNSGGIQQVVIGLAHGLSQLEHSDAEYFFMVYPDPNHHRWLQPYLSGPCQLLPTARGPRSGSAASRFGPSGLMRRAWNFAQPTLSRHGFHFPKSDGTIENAGIDVMQFTFPTGFQTSIPSIYHPHDLQHRHLPQYFSTRTRRIRDAVRRTMSRQAAAVAVMTEWGKQDLVNSYRILPEKVHVVPWAPAIEAYPEPSQADLNETRTRLKLPPDFIFYPAKTYFHKNHLGLLEALAYLRKESGLSIPLVLSGTPGDAHQAVMSRIHDLGLADAVQHVGFVSANDVACLYRLCRCVVFPTFFEGWGFPLTEAFYAGAAVACSNVTCLPELAGHAALTFDPRNVAQIALHVKRIWTDAELHRRLVSLGRQRARHYRWIDVAEKCRQLYHLAARRPHVSRHAA